MNSHLTAQQMLAYVDGELSKSETRRAKIHLHSCWTCLTEMERLKADIATILDAQAEYYGPALPPPSRPWSTLEGLLARTSPSRFSLWQRLAVYLNPLLTPARLVSVSAVLAILLVSGYSIFRSQPVSAKEVLRRIQIADMQRSEITKEQVIRERVYIRKATRSQSGPRLARMETWKSPTATYWNVSQSDTVAADLKAKYKAHNIPVNLPLSAASLGSWSRAAGGSPVISPRGSAVDVSFAGTSDQTPGAIERVSVLVQPETWQVKQMTLEFSDASFEVTEDDFSVIPTREVPAEMLSHLEPEAPASTLAQRMPAADASVAGGSIQAPTADLDQAELDVFATLHNLKADLGEPLTVTRTSHVVEIGIWQLPSERQDELRSALASHPGVEVELTAPRRSAKANAQAETTPPSPLISRASGQIEEDPGGDRDQRLLKFFGSSEREEDFTNEALATSTAILSHLYALRILQTQFPAEKAKSLSSGERTQLDELVRDHATAVATNIDSLGRHLAPLDANFNITPCASSPTPVMASWQDESLGALETARVMDHLLRALLTTSRAPAVPDVALPEIDQSLCRLRAESNRLTIH